MLDRFGNFLFWSHLDSGRYMDVLAVRFPRQQLNIARRPGTNQRVRQLKAVNEARTTLVEANGTTG